MSPAAVPDPVARRSGVLVRLFAGVFHREVARTFTALRLLRPGLPALPEGRPVVALCNHPSWWDPAVIAVLATRLLPGRRSFGPIDAAALKQYPFMARIGLYPVDLERPSGARAFLSAGVAILDKPDTVLWVTGQGRFTDARVRPPGLRRGTAALLARCPDAVLLPVALDYGFWNERRPEAFVAFGTPQAEADDEAGWSGRCEEALAGAQDVLAAATQARDPARFTSLVDGRRGVGGVYGHWQRLRAAWRGEPYVPGHDPVGRARP